METSFRLRKRYGLGVLSAAALAVVGLAGCNAGGGGGAETIREALGREPTRPEALEGIEALPQRVEVMDADAAAVKAFIAART